MHIKATTAPAIAHPFEKESRALTPDEFEVAICLVETADS